MRPRLFNYHEEGGWRIIRQEEEKKKHKYDFLYLTENGIYGEEKAHLRKGAGTAASGYYEYTGDDGELYRVNYKSDERGFIPEADHIPTPPPVPDAIKRALEYVAKKKEIHGKVQSGQYEHKPGPVKLQNMPTIDRPVVVPVKPLAPPTIPPQPRFVQYDSGNQYKTLPTGLGSVVAQQDQPQQYVSQNVAPYESIQPAKNEQAQPELLDQFQSDQPQSDQPQADQPEADIQQFVQPQEQMQADQPQADQIQVDEPQAAQPQPEQPKAEQPLFEQPLAVQPQVEEKLIDQPQYDQPQEQQDQVVAAQPLAEQPQSVNEEQPQAAQSAENQEYFVYPVEYVEQVPQASEQVNEFQPAYQVPEQLKDENNYEYATA